MARPPMRWSDSLRAVRSRGRRGCRRPGPGPPRWRRSSGRAARTWPPGSPWWRRAARAVRRPPPPFGELGDEVGVVPLGVLHPHHVVEQQIVGVGRRQPAVRHAGAQTRTLRSLPTSEWTPRTEAGPVLLTRAFHWREGGRSVRTGPELTARSSRGPAPRCRRPPRPPTPRRAPPRRGEEPAPLLPARLDEEEGRRGVEDEGDEDELRPGRVQQERGVERRHGGDDQLTPGSGPPRPSAPAGPRPSPRSRPPAGTGSG